MKLLTIDEVQRGLDAEFLPLEPHVTGLRLIAKAASPDSLQQVEARLGVTFPEDFKRVISKFDLGNLAIGPVSFCGTGNYLTELLQLNEQVQWWGPGPRPVAKLMVANSDPYVFLLDVTSGQVSAFDRDEMWSHAKKVAGDFESFVRGVGTVMLLRVQEPDKQKLGTEVSKEVEAADEEFWQFLAR